MPNMKVLSLRVKKLWPMLKLFGGQTDGRIDRQSDHYRAPALLGGAITNIVFVRYINIYRYQYGYSSPINVRHHIGFIAQWITRLPSKQDIPGSNPTVDKNF